jgi:hypothetical protein
LLSSLLLLTFLLADSGGPAGVISNFNSVPALLNSVAGFTTFASIPAFSGVLTVLAVLLLLSFLMLLAFLLLLAPLYSLIFSLVLAAM